MKKEDLEVGCAPTEEQSATGGPNGSLWRAWHEGRAFLGQLRRTFGPEPAGCELYLRQWSDSLGWHATVHCSFDKDSREAAAYAARCVKEKPTHWDAEARAFMGLDPQPSLPLHTVAVATTDPKPTPTAPPVAPRTLSPHTASAPRRAKASPPRQAARGKKVNPAPKSRAGKAGR